MELITSLLHRSGLWALAVPKLKLVLTTAGWNAQLYSINLDDSRWSRQATEAAFFVSGTVLVTIHSNQGLSLSQGRVIFHSDENSLISLSRRLIQPSLSLSLSLTHSHAHTYTHTHTHSFPFLSLALERPRC